MATTEVGDMHVSLEEFISDYLQLESASKDSNHDIAMAYVDQTLDEDLSESELDLLVHQTAEQVGYYR
jgi:hypothetical protein